MRQRVGIFLAAAILSSLWYFSIGYLDSARLNHQYTTISVFCLDERPGGTIYTPEGAPSLPAGEYTFAPLGFTCEYVMRDGSTTRTSYPSAGATIVGALPLAATVAWFSAVLLNKRRSRAPGRNTATTGDSAWS
jgi:hypothetical protein